MARKGRNEDLLMDDELTTAFLSDDDLSIGDNSQTSDNPGSDDWSDEDNNPVPGQLAIDLYETREKLVVKARTAGVNKNDLDVSISDNTLSVRGTLSAGIEEPIENHFVQECYWGEFSRSITLPVPVKEDEIEAVLRDGVLTITFQKLKQETIKKIQVQ